MAGIACQTKRNLATPVLAFCLMLSGCSLVMIGPPAEELDLTSQNDAEENLKAIRAILADQLEQSPSSTGKPSDTSSVPLSPGKPKPPSEPYSTVNPLTPSA